LVEKRQPTPLIIWHQGKKDHDSFPNHTAALSLDRTRNPGA
jgi:hypothetical protein